MAFAPDGKSLVSGGDDGSVLITRLPLRLKLGLAKAKPLPAVRVLTDVEITLAEQPLPGSRGVRVFQNHTGAVTALTFAGGGTLVSAGRDGKIVVCAANGKVLRTLEDHPAAIKGLALAADGKTLALVGDNKAVRLWDWLLASCCESSTATLRTWIVWP